MFVLRTATKSLGAIPANMKRIVIERGNPQALAYLPVAILLGPEGAEKARMVLALVDTGADHTVIHASILRELMIHETGRQLNFTGAGAFGTISSAWVRLGFTGVNDVGEHAALVNSKEIGVAESLSGEMVVGMDVLGCFDLSFQRSGRVELTWD